MLLTKSELRKYTDAEFDETVFMTAETARAVQDNIPFTTILELDFDNRTKTEVKDPVPQWHNEKIYAIGSGLFPQQIIDVMQL